jgi:hypothetical protein
LGEGAIISTARVKDIDGPSIKEGWNLIETDAAVAFPALIKKFSHRFQKILWIDSSNQANTHYFESRPELLEKVSIARAFTALQHHELCKNIGGYDLVVIPEIDRLYQESSLYRSEAVELFEEMLNYLGGSGRIIYSISTDLGRKAETLKDHRIEVESTDQGLKYSDSGSVTRSYYLRNCIQTTVPAYEEVNRKKWEEPIRPTETV